jgi:hypothetical protein
MKRVTRTAIVSLSLQGVVALLPRPLLAQQAPIAAQRPLEDSLEGPAKQAYSYGRMLFDHGDFPGALAKYSQSYDLSKDPRLLYDMSLCERNLHAYARMQALLLRYKTESGSSLSPDDQKAVDAALTATQNLIGKVNVEVSEPGASVTVDGVPTGSSPLGGLLTLDLGAHTIVVTKSGFEYAERVVDVVGGSESSVAVELIAVAHPRAHLVVAARQEATVTIDGSITARGRYDGSLPAGLHEVRVTESGKVSRTAQVDLREGETRTMDVTLDRETHGAPAWPWIVGGVVVAAGAAVGGYFLLRSPQEQTLGVPPGQTAALQLSGWRP